MYSKERNMSVKKKYNRCTISCKIYTSRVHVSIFSRTLSLCRAKRKIKERQFYSVDVLIRQSDTPGAARNALSSITLGRCTPPSSRRALAPYDDPYVRGSARCASS